MAFSRNGRSYDGYKNHLSIDVKYGFIREYEVSNASVHDSQLIKSILNEENEEKEVWGDSAYRSFLIETFLRIAGYMSKIHQKGNRGKKLSEAEKEENKEKSKIRAKVEHNFGSWVNEMGGKLIKVIGENRAKAVIGLRNLESKEIRLLEKE